MKTLCFGPYYMAKQENYKTIDWLNEMVKRLGKAENEGLKAGVRQWLSLMHESQAAAEQRRKRLESLISDTELLHNLTDAVRRKSNNKPGEEEQTEHYAAYDVLAYYTINNQETNN